MKIMEYHTEAPRVGVRSLQGSVSAEEWKTRVDLAACYRLIELFGWSDLISTHVSARIPGTDEILINPYGYLFDEITASSLVKITIAGELLMRADDSLNINPAGYVVHSAVHEVRPDVGCVVHTHTRAGAAIAALECGLLPLNQTGLRFANSALSYHEFEGPVVTLDERQRMQGNLGTNNAMVLRNHGLLTCGVTIAEAFYLMRALERSCQVQLDAMACQSPLHLPSAEVIGITAHQFSRSTRRAYGVLEWPALLRRLDKIDPSFRQ
jgi:ribulose-5-phosphate 4-epimerase/fuculose-1-phosphate aldolase